MASALSLRLRSGAKIPAVGLGCWKIAKADCAATIHKAIKLGYRHLDCAADYGNEVEVGAGIRAALAEGIVTREELWVTTKLWNTYHQPQHVAPALARSLADLGLDYVDLFLIHFPISLRYVPFETRYPPEWVFDPKSPNPRMELEPGVPLLETWRAMVGLKGARHFGVCNMTTGLLTDLFAGCVHAGLPIPEVLQVECHPYLVQEKLRRFGERHGIVLTAFSPLGVGSYVELGADAAHSALIDPVIVAIAARLRVTPAQVVLGWNVRRGLVVVPKSRDEGRLAQNLASVAVGESLSDADVAAISALDKKQRFNDPGVFCEAAFGTPCPIFD